MSEMLPLIDARCERGECRHYELYRMIGSCSNCHLENLKILLTRSHPATGTFRCPVCLCVTVSASKLDDSVPEQGESKMGSSQMYGSAASQAQLELLQRIENDLTLHPPVAEGVGDRMDALRETAKGFANTVVMYGHVPSREVSLALTKIEEALFYAIASVARNQ